MVDSGGASLAPLASLAPATKNRELFDEGSHPNSDNRFGETCAFHTSARVEIRWTFHRRDSFQFAECEAFLFSSSQISRLLHRPSLLLNLFVDAIALAVRGAESEAHCKSAQLEKTPKSGYPSCELLVLSACETEFRIEHGSLN